MGCYICGHATQTQSRRLISMDPSVHGFGPIPELQPLKKRFLLITHIFLEAYATILTIRDGVESRYTNILCKY